MRDVTLTTGQRDEKTRVLFFIFTKSKIQVHFNIRRMSRNHLVSSSTKIATKTSRVHTPHEVQPIELNTQSHK